MSEIVLESRDSSAAISTHRDWEGWHGLKSKRNRQLFRRILGCKEVR